MAILRKIFKGIVSVLDNSDEEYISLPCPACRGKINPSRNACGVHNELIFYRCDCGAASAWYWDNNTPRLIYSHNPPEVDWGFSDDPLD